MWAFWFLVSAACVLFAARLIKKRREFKYAKKEAVYSTKTDAKPKMDTPPINAEYFIESERAARPPPPAPHYAPAYEAEKTQPMQTDNSSPWGAMDAAPTEKREPANISAPEENAENRDTESEEEKNRQAAFKNLRFFDS